ncbi:acyl-CoA thioesterase [Sinomicrobium weinanense]|uniref:Acyl-CoA thioesterase n=1 Tax=Sinomicrobium weinanense TaxID=2842200 RepID=A0A926JTK5_9FLAO|nr:thioesterase family protein [Sinomicrobium weinanense]MBC9797069.1 acyl-CoA thioesterase [Sinomicrobium weinanense]MBU3122702.1 acyl-CoA thioesterase [Sinomicrobium weinanense]
MKTHEIQIRIRYGETDQMGVVYHGNYAQFVEMGRVEWLRNIGVSYRSMEENGIMLPVISLQLDYKKPARYDDLISVSTTLKKMPGVKIEFEYKIYNEKREILTFGSTVLAFVDMKTGRPVRCPDYLLEKIRE